MNPDERLRPGTPVSVLKGEYLGCTGIVDFYTEMGSVQVSLHKVPTSGPIPIHAYSTTALFSQDSSLREVDQGLLYWYIDMSEVQEKTKGLLGYQSLPQFDLVAIKRLKEAFEEFHMSRPSQKAVPFKGHRVFNDGKFSSKEMIELVKSSKRAKKTVHIFDSSLLGREDYERLSLAFSSERAVIIIIDPKVLLEPTEAEIVRLMRNVPTTSEVITVIYP